MQMKKSGKKVKGRARSAEKSAPLSCSIKKKTAKTIELSCKGLQLSAVKELQRELDGIGHGQGQGKAKNKDHGPAAKKSASRGKRQKKR